LFFVVRSKFKLGDVRLLVRIKAFGLVIEVVPVPWLKFVIVTESERLSSLPSWPSQFLRKFVQRNGFRLLRSHPTAVCLNCVEACAARKQRFLGDRSDRSVLLDFMGRLFWLGLWNLLDCSFDFGLVFFGCRSE
jgi:hypothetical protein